MPTNDFYPASMDAKVPWHQNFAKYLPDVKTKYGLSTAQVDGADTDAQWMAKAVEMRHELDAASQQCTKWFAAIAGNDDGAEVPEPFSVSLPDPAIVDVKPGIERRVREIAKQIKSHPDYSEADGEKLGIVPPAPANINPDDRKPELKCEARMNYEIRVAFRKYGLDGIRLEYRHNGGQWIGAGFLINSPGSITVAPATPGQPEQVEVRAIYIQGNNTVGNWSDNVPVTVAP
jgi:hypothetical protein